MADKVITKKLKTAVDVVAEKLKTVEVVADGKRPFKFGCKSMNSTVKIAVIRAIQDDKIRDVALFNMLDTLPWFDICQITAAEILGNLHVYRGADAAKCIAFRHEIEYEDNTDLNDYVTGINLLHPRAVDDFTQRTQLFKDVKVVLDHGDEHTKK